MHPDSSVSLVARLYPALATGDTASLDELLDEDFVGRTTPGLPLGLGGVFVGAREMRRNFWGAIGRAYEVTAEPAEFLCLPDGRVTVVGTYRGVARGTGRPLEAGFVHTVSLRDGRIVELVQLTDSAAWVDALRPADAEAAADASPVEPVVVSVVDGVGRLQLQRPARANAIDVATARGIRAAADRFAGDPSVRVVLITGAGTRFSAGGDLDLFAGTPADELPTLLDAMITDFHIGLHTLATLPVPVVCSVQGAVGGGAMGLLYGADVVLAAEGTKFATGFAALALSGDGGGTWYLPRLVGARRAAAMYLLNQPMTADEALRCGLVSQLVPEAELPGRTDNLIRRLATGPTAAYAATRRLLRGSTDRSLAEQLDAERRELVALAGEPNAVEGIAAFAGKRTPTFT